MNYERRAKFKNSLLLLMLICKNESKFKCQPIRKPYFEIWIHFHALTCTLLSLLYEFTCVTVVSKRVLDKNLFWFILSCLSSIFIKRKCHFYRPILVVSEILSQWEFLQYNSLIFLSLINLLISREI